MTPRDGTAAPKTKRDISEVQVAYILDNLPDAAIYPPRLPGASGPAPVKFLYRRRTVLTRNEDVKRVFPVIPTVFSGDRPVRVGEVTQPVPGLAFITLEIAGQPNLAQEGDATFAVLDAVEKRLGPGLAAPDHLMSVTGDPPAGNCPATEPDPVPGNAAPYPGISRSGCDGQGTRVAVVDTGLVEDAVTSHPWLRGVTGDPDLDVSSGDIQRYGGHGTFIASIVRAMAPQAEVRVTRMFEKAGALFESDIVKALLTVLDWSPHVISLSAGSHTWNYRGSLSFYVFVKDHLSQHPETVLVAAAGNDGADWKFSPAEMDEVIGVGALDRDADARASFSDYGKWVKVFAPGQDLVHAFASGKYEYQELRAGQHADFHGMARWSGTSFSTPVVAGLIGARMLPVCERAPNT